MPERDPSREHYDHRATPSPAAIDRETLYLLAGLRSKGDAMKKAAVRIEDVIGIVQFPAKLQSAKVSAAPTQSDYNALQHDVAKMQEALMMVATALNARLQP
jgi:hypothetical protein